MKKGAQELRDLSVEELQAELIDVSRALFLLRSRENTDVRKQPHLVRKEKLRRARLLTVLTEKQAKSAKAGA